MAAIRLSRFLLVGAALLVLPLTGCSMFGGEEDKTVASAASQSNAKPAAKRAEVDKLARRHEKAERDLGVARQKLEKARMAMEHALIQAETAIAKAENERAVAAAKLENFIARTAPTRIARTELDLQRNRDSFTESLEELAQLEKMYGEETFADSTKEIVLERSRRAIERSRRSLDIAERELTALREKTLPLEQREIELALEAKVKELEKARREQESSRLDREIAVQEAENEIRRLEGELADVRKEQEEAAAP
jgi:hypothetical protein